jgi:uncharacterized protein (TIGR03382 family)
MRRLHALLATLLVPFVAGAGGATLLPVVSAGPATQFVVEIPPRIRIGTPTDITVVAVDSQYFVVTDYVGTINFFLDQANVGVAALPATYTFTTADKGRHTFSGGVIASREASFRIYVTEQEGTTSIAGFADVTAVSNLAPIIRRDASSRAVLGQPWIYNAEGRVIASGATPMTFEACTGPVGFQVDATTGRVTWTPNSGGVRETLCIRAQNNYGSDDYVFYVNVSFASAPPPPVAILIATPDNGPAGVEISLDASQSSGDPEPGSLRYSWHFGDGAAAPLWYDPLIYHRYLVPGGWNAEVRVRDGYGAEAVTSVPIRITDDQGQLPPLAKIHANQTSPGTFDFSCDCSPDTSGLSYAWDFGNGEISSESSATVLYAPGRYHPTLVVVGPNNLSTRDTIEVIVTGPAGEIPPSCDAWAAPASAGPAPLATYLSSAAAAGTAAIANIEWDIGGTVIAGSDIRHEFAAGYHEAKLRVTALDGLTCTATVAIIAIAEPGKMPLAFVSSPPTTDVCGVKWRYRPGVVGTGAITVDVPDRPEGLKVDDSGELTWMPDPRLPTGTTTTFTVTADNGRETVAQSVSLVVPSCEPVVLTTCGCGASGGLPAFLGAALLWLTVRFRRRRGDRV